MSCGQFVNARIETIKAKWRQMIREGIKNGPAVIVLDDLDLLCPAEQELVRRHILTVSSFCSYLTHTHTPPHTQANGW
jgi:hypothetical protein